LTEKEKKLDAAEKEGERERKIAENECTAGFERQLKHSADIREISLLG